MTHAYDVAWVDGRIVRGGEPALAADAAGIALGLGLFETLPCVGGVPAFLDEHLERLAHGAEQLELAFRVEDGRRALAELVAALASPRADVIVLRLTLLAGRAGAPPSLVATARAPELPPAGGVELVLVPRALLARDPLNALKTVARPRYVLARRRARELGAWDALLGSDEGDVLEAANANLFVVTEAGRLLTPSRERGCLPGITRARLLAALEARSEAAQEGRVEPADLTRAQEIFLTSSVAGVIPVSLVQGWSARLPGPAGPWTRLATALLAAAAPGNDKGGAQPGATAPPGAHAPSVEEEP